MGIVIKSGLLAAVATVQTFFDDNSVVANVEVGWKRRPRQDNQSTGGANRVVFIPSLDKGAGGKLVPVRFPGPRNVRDASAADPTKVIANVRSLLEWERSVQISVWAVDPTGREDESKQIEAVESLFEWTVRAIHGSPGAFASLVWGDVTWTPPIERAFGLELLADLTFRHPIFDSPRELVYPDAAAVHRTPYTEDAASGAGGDT